MSLRIPLLLALAVLAAAAVSFLPATAARAASLGGWNLGEQRAVREAGVLHNLDDQAFHGERPLSGHELPEALAALGPRLGVAPVAAPAGRVSVTTFDRVLVDQLGATDVAAAVQHQAWRAGLQPPASIALSPDWMIHASDQGVYVSPLRLDSWRAKRFSWARRVL